MIKGVIFNWRKRPISRLLLGALATLAITTLFLSLQSGGHAATRTEGPKNVPYYARIAGDLQLHDGELAVIYFYRPPECVPSDFNLLRFFDAPRAFSCNPPTTHGFGISKEGPPIHSMSFGDAIPFWFVSWPELRAEVADGVLTIDDLEALNPLVGTATQFKEVLNPAPFHPAGVLQVNAQGELEDGRSFRVTIASPLPAQKGGLEQIEGHVGINIR